LGNRRNRSALSAWLARISAEKAAVYEPSVRELENSYHILSVTLNEGLGMREAGELWNARSVARLCVELAERHGAMLQGALMTIERRSRHFALLPEVQPLDPENFRSEDVRSSCFWNGLLHHVLFGARSRWFHKIMMLHEILGDVQATFLYTATEIAEGFSVSPVTDWATLERSHDDWNTCLRETTVLLKCLLTTLAPAEVEDLRHELETQRRVESGKPSKRAGEEVQEGKTSRPKGRPQE
jgi:hypothetical protein